VANDAQSSGRDSRVWLGEKLSELQRKCAVLDALRQSLADWERDVDWSALPPAKQRALLALAEESVSMLKSMIAKLEAETSCSEAPPDGKPGKDGTHV